MPSAVPKVFSDVSKLVQDSIAVSFGPSGDSTNCDKSCRVFENCYAIRSERLYPPLQAKLERHQRRGALWVIRKAIATMPAGSLRWARLNVDGSLPDKSKFSRARWERFAASLRDLVEKAQGRGARWHIPVETVAKARAYRAALRGLGVTVRRSSQVGSVAQLLKSKDARSWIAGDVNYRGVVTKRIKAKNTRLAFEAADQIRSAGQSCVVCPAIAGSSKCGRCLACADHAVDVVLFPFHG